MKDLPTIAKTFFCDLNQAYELLKESGFQLFCGESNIKSFLLLEWKIIKHKIISVSIT